MDGNSFLNMANFERRFMDSESADDLKYVEDYELDHFSTYDYMQDVVGYAIDKLKTDDGITIDSLEDCNLYVDTLSIYAEEQLRKTGKVVNSTILRVLDSMFKKSYVNTIDE